MKTQYIARASVSSFTSYHGEKFLSVFNVEKITTARAQSQLIEHTAKINGLGSATVQLIPVTYADYKRGIQFISADALKR